MPDSTTLPPVQEYPGYFATKPPFWRRRKTQVFTAGAAGLVLGLLVAPGGSNGPSTAHADQQAIEARIDAEAEQRAADLVDEAVGEAVDRKAAAVDDAVEDAVQEAVDREERLADRRVAHVRKELRQVRRASVTARNRAVAAAVARTKRQMRTQFAATAPAASTSSGSAGTDPRFSYCYEANDAGFGPYYQGSDPEYGWYDDADQDGIVCEP